MARDGGGQGPAEATIRPRRGEVYVVDFEPAFGAEIRKRRPGLILQGDRWNRRSRLTIVAALTSNVDPPRFPTEVFVPAGEEGLWLDSLVVLNQIRSVDKRRLLRRLGALEPATVTRVDRALRNSLGLLER